MSPRTAGLFSSVLLILSGLANAQDPAADAARFKVAREVVQDLGRIVAPSGVQETYKTRIGGIDQWLSVRGQDRDNPIILFVHGGPASPYIPTLWQFQRPWEEYFTMVNWDQRGAGKTFNEVDPASIADTIHIARYVDDAIEVAEHLRSKYKKPRIILMGHSWGTVVAMGAALKRPDLFYAYVGVGQDISTQENERISFEYGLAQAKAHHNADALKELESIAPYPGDKPVTRERIIIARKWPQFYGGLSAFREDSPYFFGASLLSADYDARDRAAIDKGSVFTLDKIMPEFLKVDFTGVHSFPIPVVMFMGRHDYTTPTEPVEKWLDQVQAPYKKGVWFERSAHMIPWEEPGRMLINLVKYVRPLAAGEGGDKD
jgi:pimeloyl-ACP methyl ester carboxylesterase